AARCSDPRHRCSAPERWVLPVPCHAGAGRRPPDIPSVFNLAAIRFDGCARALGELEPAHHNGALELARGKHADTLDMPPDEPGALQGVEIDRAAALRRRVQLVQAQLGYHTLQVGPEARLRDAPLERHLPAFEAHLVVPALARTLALVAAAAGLALTRRLAAA